MTTVATASGSLFGLAYGDALGAPTEFMTMAQIARRYGTGPRDLEGDPARVTDDTQMALAVGDALLSALGSGPLTGGTFAPPLRDAFVAWSVSPDNDRAPGMACMRACRALAAGDPWLAATQRGSKGCGANMRVAPLGVVPGLADEQRAAAAQLQAALTHGHPTALAASELTAYAIWWLREGTDPADLPGALRERCHAQRTVYHAEWLGDLWRRPSVDGTDSPDGPADFIARGWDECLKVLDALDAALLAADRDGDPCTVTGAGWIAEEALATGLLCFLFHPDDPTAAISRAAASSGDSDSIACLAGAFAGAHLGLGAWPAAWAERIEYATDLRRLGGAWD